MFAIGGASKKIIPIAEAEPLAAEEVLAKCPPIEEAKADSEPEVAQQTNGLSECKAEDPCEEPAGNTEKLNDEAGEIVSLCTSCTIMLLKTTSTEDFGTLRNLRADPGRQGLS